MVGAPLRGAVGARRTGRGLQAGHQPGLPFRPVRRRKGRLQREALPGGLLGHADPLADLRPRAPGLARFRHEVADHLVGARCQFFADPQRGLDPVER
jgi:hypothetical protein